MDAFYMLESLTRELAVNPLRRGLSILGVIIGTAAVIASLAVVEGGREQLQRVIERLGVNIVYLQDRFEPTGSMDRPPPPKMKEAPPPDKGAPQGAMPMPQGVPPELAMPEAAVVRPQTLSLEQVALLARKFPSARRIAPQLVLRADAGQVGARPIRVSVEGGTPAGMQIRNLRMAAGRYLTDSDIDSAAKVCVLGATMAARLFSDAPALGRHIALFGDRWEIVGVLEARGSLMTFDYDNLLIVPITAAHERTGQAVINALLLQGRDTASALALRRRLAEEVFALLPDRDPDDFRVFCQDELLEQKEKTLQTFRILVACIAAFSMIVSGIGIMNIMLVSVRERTREIGVWKAVGAKDRDVLAYFLGESVLTCLLGGALGVALGLFLAEQASVFIAQSVSEIEGWQPVFRPVFFLLAAGTATIVGLLSGLFPAMLAARLDPAESLRYE